MLQTEFIIKQKEVTAEKYEEMLGCLPPERMTSNAFLVGEPVCHNSEGKPMFDLYFTEGEKYYYGGLATVSDFNTWIIGRKCTKCGDELSINDDLECGYHQFEK